MKQLVCIGCGYSENMNNPNLSIHPMQLLDLAPVYETPNGPDKPIEEDLCKNCRIKVRQIFFGEEDSTLLHMPLMQLKGL
jgi:hypothetical protein